MAWSFADSFDLYQTNVPEAVNGYWDANGANPPGIGDGRFPGSRAITLPWSVGGPALIKTSGVNDSVHHLVFSFMQPNTFPGGSNNLAFCFFDGSTAQCTLQFMGDGTVKLCSGGPSSTPTVLDSFGGLWTAQSQWVALEFEVVISGTAGSWAVRKNGNPVNDHALGGLNTRSSANNYANKIAIYMTTNGQSQYIDDFFWRSDASSVAWLGDIRCYTRMPVSDVSTQFSRFPTTLSQSTIAGVLPTGISANVDRYCPFISIYDGTLTSAMINNSAAFTGNVKVQLYASSGGKPSTPLGSTATVTNPSSSNASVTFSTPGVMVKGTQYFLGLIPDSGAASASNWNRGSGATGWQGSTPFASFPVASPTVTATDGLVTVLTVTITANNNMVSEAQEDGLTSYVYDSNPGDQDWYNINTIPATPAVIFAVVTRAYAIKSDAGTRTMVVQLKSGGTTVQSPTIVLTTSNFQWTWRMDLTDPNTGAAWTAAAVNIAQIGPKVIA